MPIREYQAVEEKESCPHCRSGFEQVEPIEAAALETCPECGHAVRRVLSAPQIGSSKSGLHDRAKNAGFTTYEKRGKGEYEKKY